jgi:hypothetical protein
MTDSTVIVVERDRIGRPVQAETFEPGDPLPAWVEEKVPRRETQTQDPREEVKHQGSGWYLLPSGETVRGKDAVREAGFNLR